MIVPVDYASREGGIDVAGVVNVERNQTRLSALRSWSALAQ
jgi:hypothetical protein